MSHLAWIDFDRDAQRAAREVMAQLTAPEARDELGLGTVRDGLADLLFPGTSTIQTRLRYMLFIPWIWQLAAEKPTPARRVDHARELEFQLCEALNAEGNEDGVIGRVAGRNLKLLPSGVYWSGLERWGIRRGTGSPEQALRNGGRDDRWADELPKLPKNFPDDAVFVLREEDAAFLRDRIVASGSASRTVLADLVLYGADGGLEAIVNATHPWKVGGAVFSTENRHLLTLAEGFARGMHGARLLYNLIAAERAAKRPTAHSHGEADALIARYSDALDTWPEKNDFNKWDPEEVYDAVRRTGRNPDPRLQAFVKEWILLACDDPHGIAENDAARNLIIRREAKLKSGGTARLSNDAALDRWGGASGADMLDYRWGTAKQFLRDLSNAG